VGPELRPELRGCGMGVDPRRVALDRCRELVLAAMAGAGGPGCTSRATGGPTLTHGEMMRAVGLVPSVSDAVADAAASAPVLSCYAARGLAEPSGVARRVFGRGGPADRRGDAR